MDAPIQFFKKQEKIYPRRVWGTFRKLKWLSMVTLLGIYYGAPWLRWDRGPSAPDQAILIDLNHTRAYFFGVEIWPQEVYYITGILILAAVGLFFVTSLFGRVWCGYACPQTVWTDLFVWVERIVQGDRNARKKLDESKWTLEKLRKKGLTHLIWLMISMCTGGAWVFYFNDAPTLLDQITHMDIPWAVGGWILGLTFSTYLMAGAAREQVCTYMCPYARFQSAMFDKDTLIIAYQPQRGEPRGKHKMGDTWEGKGHCIDCDSCVTVCPMGIDIRNGLQMECIACGLCIDACDGIMEKIGLPKGLIRYDTESKKPFNPLRPRTFWYGSIISLVGCLMLYSLLTRSPLEMNVIHDRNPLFVRLSDGSVRNGYNVSIINKHHEDKSYSLTVEGIDNAAMRVQASSDIPADNLPVFADSIGHFRVFLMAPKQPEQRRSITFHLMETDSKITVKKDTIFISEGR
ncbi:MAG: cytochrome c oxidase accessory protein CcoG [Rickettsiales bacterium]|nr:cytochrome c oxidase accessory protein CcoG [Rickettsiales bacterium]